MNSTINPFTIQRKRIFDFLALRDTPQQADIIMGFGHFDMNIPKRCCELYLQGFGRKILYTGGMGAGSADFENAEAIEFLKYTKELYPQIPFKDIIIEDKSTNTGENIRFCIEKMREVSPGFHFLNGITSAVLVATPVRQLRVLLTAAMYLKNTKLINLPPYTSFEENRILFLSKNEDFGEQLTGEIERLLSYPQKGFCKGIAIPGTVLEAFREILKN